MWNKIDKKIEEFFGEKDKKESKKEREKYRDSLTAEFQLGVFVGYYIIDNDLPTISTSGVRTKNCISIPIKDYDEHERVLDVWFNNQNKENWGIFIEFSKELYLKYLPETFESMVDLMKIRDEEEFKKGIISSLWDSDACHYSLKPEEILIEDDEDLLYTRIKFKRNV